MCTISVVLPPFPDESEELSVSAQMSGKPRSLGAVNGTGDNDGERLCLFLTGKSAHV